MALPTGIEGALGLLMFGLGAVIWIILAVKPRQMRCSFCGEPQLIIRSTNPWGGPK